MSRREIVRFGAALCVGLAASDARPARSQDAYPTRPVTVVVPFPAGSGTDAVARKLAASLQEQLGQAFVIENKGGADGIIAARFVAAAPPDGYTLLIGTNTTHAANPSIYRELPYDPVRGFSPIGGIVKIPLMLAVRADFPANTFREFLARARAADPKLSYGSANTSSRASGELLKARTGIDMNHVAYRGSPQALTDLVGGSIDVFFADLPSALGMVRDRTIKILAATDDKRINVLPDVPTMQELGVPNYRIVAWVALFGPAGLSDAIAEKINGAINNALARPDVRSFISGVGSDPFPTSRSALDAFVRADAKDWAEIVEIAKIERK